MRKTPLFKLLATYLVFGVFFLSMPVQSWAMFVPSTDSNTVRTADRDNIQRLLESSVIKQRLNDYGLSSEETMKRIDSLSDQQVHEFAQNLDSIQAGGDFDGLIFLLLVAILVVVILQASGHRVIVVK
jgi:hypothetical protein